VRVFKNTWFTRFANFIYGFAKADKENITRNDLRVFKNRSKDAFSMTEAQINLQLKEGNFIEVF